MVCAFAQLAGIGCHGSCLVSHNEAESITQYQASLEPPKDPVPMLLLHISIPLHFHSRNGCSILVDANVFHIGGDANPLELRNSTPTLDIVLSTDLLNLGNWATGASKLAETSLG